MIKDEVKRQEAGDGSTNLQAQNITIQQGLTYSDVMEIALDVYKQNALELAADAKAVATERAEEIANEFIEELKERAPDAINSMATPAMQHALFNAQKAYAVTGDKDLEGLLVDILIDRAKEDDRSIQQVVLDEALTVAPKLNSEQMDALTINFLITRTRNQTLIKLDSIRKYFNEILVPFIKGLTKEPSCYEHLEYAGCVSISLLNTLKPVEVIYRENYPGLFMKGFELAAVEERLGNVEAFKPLLINCLHDNSKLQFAGIDFETVKEACSAQTIELDVQFAGIDVEVPNEACGAQQIELDEDLERKLKALFDDSRMTAEEIRDHLVKVCPDAEYLFDVWQNSKMSNMVSLTTVGIAVAHANFRRRTGEQLDLSIWVK